MTLNASSLEPPSLIEVSAERARRSLSAFVTQAWRVVEPAHAFTAGWHIDAIAAHLEAITAGELTRLVINVPPRHGKSLLVSVFWPAWVWASSPEQRWLFASYAQTLSTRDSVRCRRLLESRWYRDRWGERFRLTGD